MSGLSRLSWVPLDVLHRVWAVKMRPTMEGGAGAEGTETLHSDEITLLVLKGACCSEMSVRL